MKTHIKFLLLFSLCFSHAQTLQVASHRPSLGDTLKQFIADTSGFTSTMPNNVSGNNVWWNFSSIVNTGTMITQAYVSPTAVASSSAFPQSNLVLSLGAGGYNFLKTVDSPTAQLELVGLNFGTFAQVSFSNSGILLRFPFTYGNTFTDPASGTFSANTGTSTINGSATGNFITTADGTGTLELGQQIIPNVLRLKSTQQFTLFQGFLPLGTVRSIIYSYYLQPQKFPLLQIQYQTLSLIAQSPSTTATARMNASVPFLGLRENFSSSSYIPVFPNPSSGLLSWEAELPETSLAEIQNIQGKTLTTVKLPPQKKQTLDVSDLPEGLYFLNVKSILTGRTLCRSRFMISRN